MTTRVEATRPTVVVTRRGRRGARRGARRDVRRRRWIKTSPTSRSKRDEERESTEPLSFNDHRPRRYTNSFNNLSHVQKRRLPNCSSKTRRFAGVPRKIKDPLKIGRGTNEMEMTPPGPLAGKKWSRWGEGVGGRSRREVLA